MSQLITIEVRDKIASCLTEKPIVCGNSDYEIHFDFDEEWNGHEVKTAVFTVNGKSVRRVFTGSVCRVPELNNTLIVWIGVFAGTIDDGTLSTSTPALVHCIPCATDGEQIPLPPPDDVYNQIVELCDTAVETANEVKQRADNGEFNGKDGVDGKDGKDGVNGKDGKTTYQYAVDGGYEGTEEDFARDSAWIGESADVGARILYGESRHKGFDISIPKSSLAHKGAKLMSLEFASYVLNKSLIPSGGFVESEGQRIDIPESITSLSAYGYGAGEGYNNIVDFENGKYTRKCAVFEPEQVEFYNYSYFRGLTFDFPRSRYDEWVKAIETVRCSHSELSFEYHEVMAYEDESSGMLRVKLYGSYPEREELQAFIDAQRANGTPVVICHGIPDAIVTSIPKTDIDIPVSSGGRVSFDGAIGTISLVTPKEFADKKYTDNIFTNALKGHKSGVAISASDVSPVEHELDIKLTGENVGGTKVIRLGKNFANLAGLPETKKYKAVTDTISGYRIDDDGNIIITSCSTEISSLPYVGTNIKLSELCPEARVGMTMRLRVIDSYSEGASKGNVCIYLDKAATVWAFTETAKAITITQNMLDSNVVFYASYTPNAVRTISNFQIELGENATEYEPYIVPSEAVADEDGNVSGLMSLAPNMTLVGENGTVIDCTYNRDINKAFEEITQAMVSLGANI